MSQNGKGDKLRFYPDEQYRDNYDKIFGKKDKTKNEKRKSSNS